MIRVYNKDYNDPLSYPGDIMFLVKKFEQTVLITTDNFDLRGCIPDLKSEKTIIAATCLAEHFDANPEEHLAGQYLVDVKQYRFPFNIKYRIYHQIA